MRSIKSEVPAVTANEEDPIKWIFQSIMAPIKSLIFLKTNSHAKMARDSRRSNSKLPGLIEFIMSRPVVSAGMIAKELSITSRAAQNLVAELGVRETTGRGRYRAWRVF
jgi:hypothetical protein